MLVPAPPKPLSKYAQRMKWLSDQIFNKMDKERFVNSETRSMGDWRVVRYFTERPMHLREDIRNLYYPPYGQMNNLVKVASEYGLFRYFFCYTQLRLYNVYQKLIKSNFYKVYYNECNFIKLVCIKNESTKCPIKLIRFSNRL